jgi:hypothetical protein
MTLSQSSRPWRIFNVLARLTGIVFLFNGLFGVLSFTLVASHCFDSTVAVGLSAFGFACVVGVLTMLVKPYRPDLDALQSAPRANAPRRRTWWTGEPK